MGFGQSGCRLNQVDLYFSYDFFFKENNMYLPFRMRLDWDENFCVCVLFGFFFSRVFERFECCGYCSCTVQ